MKGLDAGRVIAAPEGHLNVPSIKGTKANPGMA
jgi:hypothetical protein